MHLNFRDRLKAAEKYINYNHTSIRLYQQANKSNLNISSYKKDDPWIEIYMKDMFEVWEVNSLFKLIESHLLLHENDGLIFTVDACPYYPGTCEQIVKWKPPEMNTIDFQIKFLGQFQHDTLDKVWGLFMRDGKNEDGGDKMELFDFFVFDNMTVPRPGNEIEEMEHGLEEILYKEHLAN